MDGSAATRMASCVMNLCLSVMCSRGAERTATTLALVKKHGLSPVVMSVAQCSSFQERNLIIISSKLVVLPDEKGHAFARQCWRH
jgi:hypothetical protein